MRVVLDTNVLISAAMADGPPRALFQRCMAGDWQLLQSTHTLEELSSVLRRPKFRLPASEVERFVGVAASIGDLVEPKTRLVVVAEDPVDNRILELALDGRADLVVSGDRHLLDLKVFRGIPILRPRDAL